MALPPKRILIVDDEVLVLESVKMFLSYDGHSVQTATNAEDALALFRLSKFDVVITDYSMEGMKGDELAAAIKRQVPQQPVILLTAHANMIEDIGRDLTAIDLIVRKPFLHADLTKAITKVTTVL